MATNQTRDFGSLLQQWRRQRGLSQMALAGDAGVSQRHLSFLESGRARPSRGMVVALATALAVPLREQDGLLLSAGFAPMYANRKADPEAMQAVERALDVMLAQQEPFPALVIDRGWNLMRANKAAAQLTAFLAGGAAPAGQPNVQPNMMRLVFDPAGIRNTIENWDEIALWLLRQVQGEALADGPHSAAAALARDLMAYPGVPRSWQSDPDQKALPPVLTMRFLKDGVRLNLFSTLTTFSTPYDVALQEVRIENFFPADAASEKLLRGWAGGRRLNASVRAPAPRRSKRPAR